MKKLVLLCLCLMLALFFCACVNENSSASNEPLDTRYELPNIDHEILDADRHLGNTLENYSSELTMLVEYGHRVYECYNDHFEIREHCTVSGRRKSLYVYGTNLSIYKNILYYISINGREIHAYDLATGKDSVWITSREIDSQLAVEEPQYASISSLIITDYGLCMLYGEDYKSLVHFDFNKNLVCSFKYSQVGYEILIPLENDCIVAMQTLFNYITYYTPSTASQESEFFDGHVMGIKYFESNKLCYYDYVNNTLEGFDVTTKTGFTIINNIEISTRNLHFNKYQNYLFYNNYDEDGNIQLWRFDLSTNTAKLLNYHFEGIACICFTSKGDVYAVVYDFLTNSDPRFIRTDLNFE